ncbi:hypothetical protein AB0M02_24370 [Actinoplanes sp. NPDC051861]|uniref:hypothetical protein n=1 Tax=Actinoplanes sp. NPDC051861 TaxID=3155170 RepID=UPI00344313EC
MSMSLCLVKLSPAIAHRIETTPDLLEQLWFADEEDEPAADPDPELAALDRDRDTLFEDYLGLSREIGDEPGTYPWMRRALQGTGTDIDFDFGYGNGFVVTAQEAAEIANGLADEGWWSPGQEVTLVPHAIAGFYHAAANEGQTIIGGVA